MTFTSARTIDGILLVQHICPRYGSTVYVSAVPSPPNDPYPVPGCGCRPVAIVGRDALG